MNLLICIFLNTIFMAEYILYATYVYIKTKS
jgi:hypothetical protein